MFAVVVLFLSYNFFGWGICFSGYLYDYIFKKYIYFLHLNNNLVTLQITIMGACALFGVLALVTIIKT